uniref:DDB1- and CUL4-associated factor 8-like n=1 Tax=Fragaria vesca subsp. vesca TaxID=101020 RepID=UPI0005C86016|nr:PREDICTED: DDB1- and CUL4-associated factor 8-like [Fragaria vesca subsp. vesca]
MYFSVFVRPLVFSGHSNRDSLKAVKFFGANDDYVMSGRTCGHMFMWKKKAELIRVIKANASTLNQVEPHPHLPVIATCGGEENVKLWAETEIIEEHRIWLSRRARKT